MRTSRLILAFVAAAWSAHALATDVYVCKTKGRAIYSDRPCGKNQVIRSFDDDPAPPAGQVRNVSEHLVWSSDKGGLKAAVPAQRATLERRPARAPATPTGARANCEPGVDPSEKPETLGTKAGIRVAASSCIGAACG